MMRAEDETREGLMKGTRYRDHKVEKLVAGELDLLLKCVIRCRK